MLDFSVHLSRSKSGIFLPFKLKKKAAVFFLTLGCVFFFSENNKLLAMEQEELVPYTGGIRDYPFARQKKKMGIRAGIVSHHGLASGMISRFYEYCSGEEVQNVILLGPDHFYAGRSGITLCPAAWSTRWGKLEVNTKHLQELSLIKELGVESLPFRLEHSIGLQVDFLAHYFPHSQVTALVVKNRVDLRELALLVPVLVNLMDDSTLLILSMDFSHGKLPERAAEEDTKTLKHLLTFNVNAFPELDIDAPRAAWLFAEILKKKRIHEGRVLEQTNSGLIAGDVNQPCTSYATVVFFER